MSNILKYDTSTIKFLMLNILGHDVIHDFGGESTPDRWSRNSDIIQQFTNTFTITSKIKSRPIKKGGQSEIEQIQSSSSSEAPSPKIYQMRLKMPPLSEEELYDEFYKIINDFKNSCIFAIFYYKIYENTSSTWGLSDLLKASFGFIVEATDNENINNLLDELFQSLCNDFITYLYSTNVSYQQFLEQSSYNFSILNFALPFDEYFEILNNFLYTNYLLDDTVNTFLNEESISISSSLESNNNTNMEIEDENIQSLQPDLELGPIIGKKRSREEMIGGKIKQLGGLSKNEELTDIDGQVKPLLSELDQYKTKYLTEENLARLGQIFVKFRDDEEIDEENINQYSQERIQMLSDLKSILNKYGQNKLSGQLDNKSIDNTPDSFIPILRKSRYGKISNADNYPKEGALNFFDNSIYNNFNKLTNVNIITHEKSDVQNLIYFIKQVNQEYRKRKREEEQEERKRKTQFKPITVSSSKPRASSPFGKGIPSQSKLTDGEIKIRQGFNEIIARTILYLTKICDKSGKLLIKREFLNGKYNNSDELLKEEIKILLCESNWMSDINNKSWKDIFGIRQLDTHLYEICDAFFSSKKMNIDNGAEIYCGEKENVDKLTNSKYIIDNAAGILNNGIRSRIFCSTSSILDGMYQCAYKDSNKRLEQGNIDFTIIGQNINDKMSYNGKSIILSSSNTKNQSQRNNIKYNIDIKTPIGDIKPSNIYSILGMENPFLNIDRASFKSPLIAHSVLKITLLLFIKQVEQLNSSSINDYQEIIRTTIRLADTEPTSKKQRVSGTSNINTLSNINNINDNNTLLETPNFFRNFFSLQVDGKHNNFNFFFNILANIYYKGTGDLFQEINVVCKNGGYLNDGSYYADPTIIKWGFTRTDGNTLRMFLARDRPSACRFAVMTIFGDDSGVNKFAFGGYSSTTKTLIVARQKVSNPSKRGKDLLCKNVGLKGGNKLTKRVKYNNKYSKKYTRKL
jgi:hypothetical protein